MSSVNLSPNVSLMIAKRLPCAKTHANDPFVLYIASVTGVQTESTQVRPHPPTMNVQRYIQQTTVQ